MMQEVEGILKSTPEVRLYGGIVAPAFSGPGQPNNAIFFIHFKEDRERSVQEIVNAPDGLRNKLFTQIEGALAFPSLPKAFTRGINAPFNLVIQAQDLDALDKYTTELVNKLRAEPWLQNVRPSFEVNKPELRLSIDRDRAIALGVSIEDISRTMQIMFGGLDLSRIKIGGKEYEVIAQLERASRLTPQALDQLYVRTSSNSIVQLSSVVSYKSGSAPNTIEHYNRLRSATISATPVGVPLGTAVQRAEDMVRSTLPQGFLYDWSGESRDLREAGQEVWFVLILAIAIVYMVLAAQFESLVHPFTVILAIPLAAVGAFGLLWLVAYLGKVNVMPEVPAMNINLFSQIGLVLLVGLVTKNSILLVEFANQQRAEGVNPHDAMLQAGIVRLRPILMTAFSTIAGILPIAIGFGAGSESRRPMGVAVVGGMLTSTFLTLIVIPVVYTLLSDFAAWLRRGKPSSAAGQEPVTIGK
jgi:multidrug efflux pump subunit AcrB